MEYANSGVSFADVKGGRLMFDRLMLVENSRAFWAFSCVIFEWVFARICITVLKMSFNEEVEPGEFTLGVNVSAHCSVGQPVLSSLKNGQL